MFTITYMVRDLPKANRVNTKDTKLTKEIKANCSNRYAQIYRMHAIPAIPFCNLRASASSA